MILRPLLTTMFSILLALSASAAIVGEWDADDFTGTDWPGTATATIREGTPTAGADNTSFPGFVLDFVSFGPPDAAFEVAAADNGVAGLAEFSASAVFRTASAGSSGENDFWRNEGLVGIELPGGGVGDWGVGIAAGGLINGGSALHAGDSGTIGPVVNDNQWHVVTMVVDDNEDGTHDRRLYLDGAEVATDLALAYGGGSSVAAGSALFFGDHQPGDPNATKENYEGDIAHIRLDDVPLTPAEITTLHTDFLGTRTPTTDSDADMLPDAWEEGFVGDDNLADLDGNAWDGTGPTPGPGAGTGDFDGDGRSDKQEFEDGTDPTKTDTDDDGLTDGEEAALGTDPLDDDSDDDGLKDGVETNTGTFNGPSDTGTDPLDPDTDGDGLFNDGEEVANNTDPNDPNDPGVPENTGALCLDGVGDFVTFANDAGLIPTGNESFTIEAWINPTSIPTGGGNGGQITFWGTQGPGGTSNGFRLRSTGGTRHYFWGNDHDENFGEDITPDTGGPASNGWHHLAITYDQSQTIWYWNGAPLGAPRTPTPNVNVADQNFRIGSRIDAEFFDGWIDELRIWDVARSEEEIANTFQCELPTDEPGLVAYWDFNGGATDFSDVTGNGHDGTPQGDSVVDPFRNAPVKARTPLGITNLAINRVGNSLEISWDSQPGTQYDLLSELPGNLGDANPPENWAVWDGNSGLAATPPRNTILIATPADLERYFVIRGGPTPPVKVFTEDFESGQGGWTTISEDEPGLLISTTEWELGPPDSNLFGNPPAANSGTNCFATDLDANYQPDTLIRLRSPAIDLSTLASAKVTYFQWRDVEVMFDFVQVRVLDASDLSEIAILADRIEGSSATWEEVTHNLPPEAVGKSVILEWVLDSDNFGDQAGYCLDDVCVEGPGL